MDTTITRGTAPDRSRTARFRSTATRCGGAAVAAAALAAILLVVARGGGRRIPAPSAIATTIMLCSLVLPALSIAFAARTDARRWLDGWVPLFAGASVGALFSAALAGLNSVPPSAAGMVVVGACAFFYGALALALSRALGAAAAGGVIASSALLILVALPFWSDGVLRTATGARLGAWLVGASPFLASAMPWVSSGAGWSFDPKTSSVLYDLWVGTDVPIAYPSWISCAAGHAVLGALLVAGAELPALVRRRRAERSES